jgi:phosphoribosylamine--glycine ligase
VHIIQAGTALTDGELVTAGGRVLAVVAAGADLDAARDAAYAGARRIEFDGVQYRTDIARAAADGQRAHAPAQPVETPSREGTR